jgi:PadR family transcriptional regulator PadR
LAQQPRRAYIVDMPIHPPIAEFEQFVLLAILQVGEDAYGPSIREEIAQRTGRMPSRGALYVTLDRLEAKGYLASRAGESTAVRGGRARRLVRVTALGRRALRESRRALLNLWRGLGPELDRR